MTATQAPTPGPLSGDDVKLLVKLLDTLKPFAEVAEKLKHCHVVEICEPSPDNPSRNIIPMPREWFERAGDDLEYIAIQLHASGVLSEGQASKITGLDRVSVRREVDRLAPTAPVEASGSEQRPFEPIEHPLYTVSEPARRQLIRAASWIEKGAYDASGDDAPEDEGLDEAARFLRDIFDLSDDALKIVRNGSDEIVSIGCVRPQPSGETREAVLKGVGKVNGDGWKDTTTEGEIVFVWNAEKPTPYAAGQYPRIGNEGWSASTSQYDFTPATANDVPAILALLSARPLALGGQQGEDWRCPDCGAQADEWFDCCKNPARAEAQDEGAAGEIERLMTLAAEANDDGELDQAMRLVQQADALYAHPSPTPAADASGVIRVLERICETQKRLYGNGTGLHLAMLDLCIDARAELSLYQAALKSTAAKEGGAA